MPSGAGTKPAGVNSTGRASLHASDPTRRGPRGRQGRRSVIVQKRMVRTTSGPFRGRRALHRPRLPARLARHLIAAEEAEATGSEAHVGLPFELPLESSMP